MNKWQVFNFLKNNVHEKPIDEYSPGELEELICKTSIFELREGVIEYFLSKMHEERERKDKLIKR